MKKNFYITTPIYYASGNLHIGHLYTTTLAWVIRNYQKLLGNETKFLTGSDEHGSKIAQKAKENNLSEIEFVNSVAAKFKELWNSYDINYDIFIRTTSENHKKTAQKIFSYFYKNNYIYKNNYTGLYSVSAEEFLTKSQALEKNGKYYHPVSHDELIEVSEESYFFKMSEFSPWLKKYFAENSNFLFPKKIENEILNNFIKNGLQDLSVTRTNVSWAIPIKEDLNHTLYVWVDALSNYISALGYNPELDYDSQSEDFKNFWENPNSKVVHLIGKEIARFHMIYWPIFLKALNLKQPTNIVAHGWILANDGKMSKSKGNVVDPNELLLKFDKEQIKYFLASQIPMGNDGVFDEKLLVDSINANIINSYGNLISRSLKMYANSFSVPLKYSKNTEKDFLEIEEKILKSKVDFKKHMDLYFVDKAFEVARELASDLNKFIDIKMPWTLKDNLKELEKILIVLFNGIYALSCYYSIIFKNKTKEVAEVLKVTHFDLEKIDDFSKFNETIFPDKYILYNRLKKD
ncbi:methionine--tRNA ligase [Mycoplasmopsis synoviae]|uniref:methionine--tRNA ligase n=1 Tax=Mycoplasmopsis synoviae TaxID=2109 RepID=UPI001CE04540|nr:methionine--tRNA ligase [Mycoplasmopsis synoviae]UBX97283.1 methionine--tRNA ligase [Mycoplasmopsis synoviae]UBX97974.1 methionine--tRNA ligase [Mycoplasmopsis synoviae]UBX98909.1 methionine--tRNA ligase [Mycoplasmopsis synoviae]UBX99329.1 methionine--tRNA ligase [Mycoplasmopsis synoviae]UBY00268.1 methionine--tRNA ligase [Mycoplasmopsis synoviae]